MKISEDSWKKFIGSLSKVNDTAAQKMTEFLDANRDSNGVWEDPEIRKLVLDYAYALSSKYGDAAAELACEMYDSVAELSNVQVPPAVPAPIPEYGEVAKAVNGIMKVSSKPDYIASGVSRQVKMVGVDTVMHNALRDGAEWAWIPSGDTCAFCIMLASRGWQKASKKALKNGHAQHIHANCDCIYGVRFDKDTEVEGYDPKEYLDMYYAADEVDEGGSARERINYMRRIKGRNKSKSSLPEPLSRYYVNHSDQLYKNLLNVTPINGYEDFAVHGVPEESMVEYETTSGESTRYTAKELAVMIREDPEYKGGNVRLLSCGAGSLRSKFAQELADELGKEILAPTETLWVAEEGQMFISDSEILARMWYNNGEIDNRFKSTGYWKPFKPDPRKD